MDLYFSEDGDIALAPNGDLAVTPTVYRDDVQQAYIRMMTDVGDYVIWPQLGADLSMLKGRPQSPETGELGIALITSALEREGRFVGKNFSVNAVPTGPQSIRFDVYIFSGSQASIKLSVEQNLGLEG